MVPGGNAGKCEVFGRSREIIHADQLRWSEGHHRLTRQLREVVGKPLAGGLIAISSPRKRGDHGDAAHALCLALWASSFPPAAAFDVDARGRDAAQQLHSIRAADGWGYEGGKGGW
jgi:hypothetical protein